MPVGMNKTNDEKPGKKLFNAMLTTSLASFLTSHKLKSMKLF